jgi:opacity protein-like surface antigen
MRPRPIAASVLALILALAHAPCASAAGKVHFYGIRMDPTDADARQYSRPGYGLGIEAVAPPPVFARLVAGVIGIEWVNLLAQTKKFQDPTTGLRVEQQTSQDYFRAFLGAQVGSHNTGFLRPYAGANLAAVVYAIRTDVVVPDDVTRQNEIRQNLRDESEAAFGWDANAGLDLNFRDRWSLDLGVRVLHAYGVPQQLGAGAVTIQPSYVQYHAGFGVSFDAVR